MTRGALGRIDPVHGGHGPLLEEMQQTLAECKGEVDDEESERPFCVKEEYCNVFEEDVGDENREEVGETESAEEKQPVRVQGSTAAAPKLLSA